MKSIVVLLVELVAFAALGDMSPINETRQQVSAPAEQNKVIVDVKTPEVDDISSETEATNTETEDGSIETDAQTYRRYYYSQYPRYPTYYRPTGYYYPQYNYARPTNRPAVNYNYARPTNRPTVNYNPPTTSPKPTQPETYEIAYFSNPGEEPEFDDYP